MEKKALGDDSLLDWELQGDILRYKGKIVVGTTTDLRQTLLTEMHSSPYGGHAGIQGTYQRISRLFFWPRLREDVKQWVKCCDTCQRTKAEGGLYPGLLQPLPIPQQAWTHISMDFIEGLPKSQGKDVILVVVDRYTKFGHFVALSHPYTAQTVAKLFLDQIYKLHGQPLSIVTDRDKVFTSNFWKELFKQMGTNLDMTSAYHPQSDGQTERVNQCLENYLRGMVHQNPKLWLKWLPLAEFWYNTNFHTSLKATPFEALYGYPPPQHSLRNYLPNSQTEAGDFIQQRDQLMQELKENLTLAQNRMKHYADLKRTEREFEVGEMVYLKLQPFRQSSVVLRKNIKLSAKYFGPYQIIDKIGKVAYRLALPEGSKIHPVFHVSLLKKVISPGVVPASDLPIIDQDGAFIVSPISVDEERTIHRRGRAVRQFLVRWTTSDPILSSWEDFQFLKKKFPNFDPCGQGSKMEGGIVMNEKEFLMKGRGKMRKVAGEVRAHEENGENNVEIEEEIS